MSTHVTQCIVCGKDCYCCSDLHAAGCGGKHGEGGCENPPYIEFCSEECFHELERRMRRSWANYMEGIQVAGAINESRVAAEAGWIPGPSGSGGTWRGLSLKGYKGWWV